VAREEAERRKAAGDPVAQEPALLTHAAARKLIAHFVGEDWFLRHAMPDGPPEGYFFPRFTGANGGAPEYTARIFNLAECLFNLQGVENVHQPIADLQNAPQIESALAELQFGMILRQDGVSFRYLVPSRERGVPTPDLEISIGNRLCFSDVKCKFDMTEYSDGCLESPFKSARRQIGRGREGFVLVKVPQGWSTERRDQVLLPLALVEECRAQMSKTSRVVKTVFYTFHLTHGADSMTNRHAVAEVNSPLLSAENLWSNRVFPCDGRGEWVRMLEIIEKAGVA
jgi:hypothetical protein